MNPVLRLPAKTWLVLAILICRIQSSAQTNAVFQIAGTITRPDDGCNQALVVLCDQASGEPLCRKTAQPFTLVMGTTNDNDAMEWLMTMPDDAGHFQFTNLPAGNYIVVAQAWSGPSQPTNLMKFRGETIHLLGRAEVTVPSDTATKLKLTTPGTNNIQFDQQFGNDDGFLMLGTRPPRGDPILAWLGWGTNFISHLIGFNSMPCGRTTVHGLPAEAYASIFIPDDSPGFGSMRLTFGETNAVKMPIVAGWSDGYKIPPTNLVWLVELLATNRLEINELLGLPAKSRLFSYVCYTDEFTTREHAKARLLPPIWEKEIVLPTGQKTRVVDLLTALGYARLSGKIKY
jgi:hypothetical protein